MLQTVFVLYGIALAILSAPPRPAIIAHRGASHDAPENTLAAFRLGWEQGADGIEADFFLTQDGQIACIHDPTTKRTAGVDRKVAETTFAELRKLDVGSWKDSKWANERVPSIDEVFATVPRGKVIYVEVKCGPEIVPELGRAIKRSGLDTHQIVVISFQDEVVAAVKEKIPGIKSYWLVSYYRDDSNSKWRPTIDEVLDRLKSCNADGLGTSAKREVVDESFVRRLREAGFEFHAWTINDAKTAKYFRSLGVDSIITDRPRFIRDALAADTQ